MFSFVRTLAHVGIHPDTPFLLRNKLKVFNSAMLIIFCICVLYAGLAVVNQFYCSLGVLVFSMGYSLFSLYLVKQKKYSTAFHATMWYGFMFLSSFSILYGNNNTAYFYFLFLPVACNILFDAAYVTVLYMLLSAAFLLANMFYIDHFPPYYSFSGLMYYAHFPNILFAVILVYMGVRVFKEENLVYSHQIEEQKKALEEKNQEITDSINYARKIQTALIPSEDAFVGHFKDAFVLFKPKDIVSGDFYWVTKLDDCIYYATADCTGHGVPGGFMTMLGISFLDELVIEKEIRDPAAILNALSERIIYTLKQTGTSGENKDGMDIVVCCLDLRNARIRFAGANNGLFLMRDGVLHEYPGDKQPCGFHHEPFPFTCHDLPLMPGDAIYTFSDGYADQFGGPKGKKFKYKKLQETLLSHAHQPMSAQKRHLDEVFEHWRAPLEQVDDVLLIGIRV